MMAKRCVGIWRMEVVKDKCWTKKRGVQEKELEARVFFDAKVSWVESGFGLWMLGYGYLT